VKVRMKVEGGDKIARKLQMIAEETARTHMREAALAGAEVIRAAAVEKAPEGKTGTLKGDIHKEIKKQTKARVEIHIGPGKDAWYGRLVEEGHKLVRVIGRTQKGRRTYRIKKEIGQVPPHPFLRPAFDEKVDEAQKKAVEELRRRLKL